MGRGHATSGVELRAAADDDDTPCCLPCVLAVGRRRTSYAAAVDRACIGHDDDDDDDGCVRQYVRQCLRRSAVNAFTHMCGIHVNISQFHAILWAKDRAKESCWLRSVDLGCLGSIDQSQYR